MRGRITFREGEAAREDVDAVLDEEPAGGDEEALRAAMRRGLERARAGGARTVAVPALPAALPLQRCAEIQLEEARAHLAGDTSLEEIRFVLVGEPALRVFESVQDGFRIAEQARRWSR